MNKPMNTTKIPQVPTSQQPKVTPLSAPQQHKAASVPAAQKPKATQPIHDIQQPKHKQIPDAAPTHDDIARRAYQIYIEKGCPQGQSEQIWQQAEQEQRDRDLAKFLSK